MTVTALHWTSALQFKVEKSANFLGLEFFAVGFLEKFKRLLPASTFAKQAATIKEEEIRFYFQLEADCSDLFFPPAGIAEEESFLGGGWK